jgi:hypothetical protein
LLLRVAHHWWFFFLLFSSFFLSSWVCASLMSWFRYVSFIIKKERKWTAERPTRQSNRNIGTLIRPEFRKQPLFKIKVLMLKYM